MVYFIESPAVGNALRVFLRPPEGARLWRVLRSTASQIQSADDPSAVMVYEGTDHAVLDTDSLTNAVPVWYRAFYLMPGGTWLATPPMRAAPATAFVPRVTDVSEVVRTRLQAGFDALLARGDLATKTNTIAVLIASPAYEDCNFPLLTVHLGSDGPGERGIGEQLDGCDAGDDVLEESEGFLSRVTMTVMAWSQNVDERKLLRLLLKAVLQANLPVFDNAGMVQIDMTFSDQDDFESYKSPMYQVVCTLSCLAPASVAAVVPAIRDVRLTVQGVQR